MFPIQMTFTVHNEHQLADLIAATKGYPAVLVPPNISTPAKQEAKPEAKKPDAPRATAAATQATAAASAAPEPKAEPSVEQPASSSEENGYTLDDAKKLTMEIVKLKGREAAVELLGKFGVPVAAKLPADQITPFCAAAERVLAS